MPSLAGPSAALSSPPFPRVWDAPTSILLLPTGALQGTRRLRQGVWWLLPRASATDFAALCWPQQVAPSPTRGEEEDVNGELRDLRAPWAGSSGEGRLPPWIVGNGSPDIAGCATSMGTDDQPQSLIFRPRVDDLPLVLYKSFI